MGRNDIKNKAAIPADTHNPISAIIAAVSFILFLEAGTVSAESYVRSAASELGTINNILKNTVQGIGSILLLYYLFDFGSSLHAGENGSLYRSLRGIAGGILFLIAPAVISVLV